MAVPVRDLDSHAWQRQRVAADIASEPKFIGDHAYLQTAYLNWADLDRIGKAVLTQFPEAVIFPACYNNRDPKYAPPALAVVPIYKSIVECALDKTHVRKRRVTIRWPWADEFESREPNILAGRVAADTTLSRWSAHRKIGRVVHIDIRFDGYARFQDIKTWNGDPYWGTRQLADGRRIADLLPEIWCFREGNNMSLQCGYQKSEPDDIYFVESVKHIWRQNTTDIYGLHDILTGELWDNKGKSYERRYGFNALKHAIDGTRRYVGISPNKDFTRFSAIGPRKAHIKKAMATIDNPLDFE
ncbi:hypothetical protein [Dongia sp.]|uniref:hypothetical protein n=1 Tax=Dongia sp. TaxID=1977262 RepID=UPI0035B10097